MRALDRRTLLELRTATPADIDGASILLRCDLPGTMQLFRAPVRGGPLERLTAFPDPVEGHFVPGTSDLTSTAPRSCFVATFPERCSCSVLRCEADRSNG